jgi:glucose-1-phosphate thymidylyltransferase
MKGIVLAGGTGSRLWPATLAISKQLIPVYDKPMIYYPISTLMLAGIRDILLIVAPEEEQRFRKLLGDGSQFGINLSYAIQEAPRGLAEAFIIGENFISHDEVCLILGDNLFYGHGLGEQLSQICNLKAAHIFGVHVSNPSDYGVVELDEMGKVIDLIEKPQSPISNWIVPGLYFYPNDVVEVAKKLIPSPRGELEITDLNLVYLKKGELNCTKLERGAVWLDMGNFSDLNKASNFVETIQSRHRYFVACLEEVALKKNWISCQDLSRKLSQLPKNSYHDYITELILGNSSEEI